MKKNPKPWSGMTIRELARATREFDREFVADTFGPMTPAARRSWAAARRKRGRPRVGRGSRAVSVTIEASLLERVDRLARRMGLTRAQLIARGLRHVLKAG